MIIAIISAACGKQRSTAFTAPCINVDSRRSKERLNYGEMAVFCGYHQVGAWIAVVIHIKIRPVQYKSEQLQMTLLCGTLAISARFPVDNNAGHSQQFLNDLQV